MDPSDKPLSSAKLVPWLLVDSRVDLAPCACAKSVDAELRRIPRGCDIEPEAEDELVAPLGRLKFAARFAECIACSA